MKLKTMWLLFIFTIFFNISASEVFRASLADKNAMVNGNPGSGQRIDASFGNSDEIQCLQNGQLSFILGNSFPYKKGSLSFWIRPTFEQTRKSPEITVLKMQDGENEISFKYYPSRINWRFLFYVNNSQISCETYNKYLKSNEWNHVLLTWNYHDKVNNTASLYLNGKAMNSCRFKNIFNGEVKLLIGSAGSKTEFADLIIYDSCIDGKIAKLMAKIKCDSNNDAVKTAMSEVAQKEIELQEKIRSLRGQVGLIKESSANGKEYDFAGIKTQCLRPSDINSDILSKYKVIIFPGGKTCSLTAEQNTAVKDFVVNGGGLVAEGQGVFTVEKMKLLDFKTFHCNIKGFYMLYCIDPHVITAGRSQKYLRMYFNNGPIIVPGDGCKVLATNPVELPGRKGNTSSILTGKCGKGNIVLFNIDTLGGEVSYKNKKYVYPGFILGSELMMTKAILYVAGKISNHK